MWAIIEGFTVVLRGYADPKTLCKRCRCIHHDDETLNDREFEDLLWITGPCMRVDRRSRSAASRLNTTGSV